MQKKEYVFPEAIDSSQIRAFRKQLHMTQQQFADMMAISKKTVESWEYGDKEITGPVVLLIRLLQEDPDLLEFYELPPKQLPIRLRYMFRHELCTIIDVDEGNRRVKIRNYTRRVQFRAFGTNENPTYEDYEAFLESRCFPRTRDKMKLVLQQLNLPFYDPMMIIQKTEGRMAEDDFWLKVEMPYD